VVGRGEVLERMTTVPWRPGASGEDDAVFLEGLWQGGGIGGGHRRPVLLCPPHPRLGGGMDSAVLAEIVWTLGRRRHPTLRFNFRGVGASQGAIALPPLPQAAPVDLGPLVDDARAALAQLLSSTGERSVAVVGVSVGALVAARLAAFDDAVERALLVAPPTVVSAIDDDDVAHALARGSVPVAVVVGADDRFVDRDVVRARLGVGAGALHVVDGADHGFARGLTAVARLAEAALGSGDDDSLM
jgi:alpha/beta superfamily hydrolase